MNKKSKRENANIFYSKITLNFFKKIKTKKWINSWITNHTYINF